MTLASEPSRAIARLADRRRVLALGDLAPDVAVEALVLEEADRVRVADRAGQQPLGVGRGRRRHAPSGPGVCRNHASGFCEWNGPPENPPPEGSRTTIGTATPWR